MDQNFKPTLKLFTLLLPLIYLSACSSSKVEEADATNPPPVEASAESKPAEANTDALPPSPPAMDSLAGNPDAAMPASSAPSGTPSAPTADAAPAIMEPAPIAEPAVVSDAAPVVENTSSDTTLTETKPAKKSKKHHGKKNSLAMNSGDGAHYTVKSGDTLMRIAFENYGDLYRWKEIYEANRQAISDPNHVPPGTELVLNGAGMTKVEHDGEQYLIKHGDTLGSISKDVYGSPRKWKKLWNNNRDLVKNPNHIYAGFYLFYKPEGRLSHEKDKKAEPAVVEGSDSAAVAKPVGDRAPATNAQVQPEANKK